MRIDALFFKDTVGSFAPRKVLMHFQISGHFSEIRRADLDIGGDSRDVTHGFIGVADGGGRRRIEENMIGSTFLGRIRLLVPQ